MVDREESLRQLNNNLKKAQGQMKKNANMHIRDLTHVEGNWVFVEL